MIRAHSRGIFFIIFLVAFYFSGITKTEAALLYFDPAQVDVFRGDTITIALRLDTDENECVNTIDATIHYDASIRAVDVSRGDSILSLWVEDPVIDEVNKTIRFAGGIPGGYCGRIAGDPSLTNVILELVFRSPGLSVGGGNNQSARIWLDDSTQALLHDGFGTPATLTIHDSMISLNDGAGASPNDTWREEILDDSELPSDFRIELGKDETAFNKQYFITFNALDKQSGIDHYEVMEEPFEEFYSFKWGGVDAPWTITASPYVLKDQTLNSTIYVKAIDKAGNERISKFVPEEAYRSISRDKLIFIIVVGSFVTLVVLLTVYALWRRKQRLLGEETYEQT